MISYQDDQARDQTIAAWKLKPDDATRLLSDDLPKWWPQDQIDPIDESGESYGRIDDSFDQWRSLWVDRERGLLYIEQGNW